MRNGEPVATIGAAGPIRLGRDADNDVVLPDLWVSGHHAEIRRTGAAYHLVDLGGTNGVHHNGRRVVRSRLRDGDRVTIGRYEYLFDGGRLFESEAPASMSIVARDLTVDIGRAPILDDVTFALRRGMLLAVVGPNGCGKSTLLDAITGYRRPVLGKVLFDGRDLYEHYSELRHRLSLVAQEAALHGELPVRRELRFAASLRFAADVPRGHRAARVDEVLDLVGLRQRSSVRIDALTSGERRRTAVALELLTEPSLLALDDPTAGLDPFLDRELMSELRQLAGRGHTVVVATNNLLHLDLCDRVLVLCRGGRVGYFGPPAELLPFFSADHYADVFRTVTGNAQRWVQLYKNSSLYRTHVGTAMLELLGPATPPVPADTLPTPRPVATAAPPPERADDTSPPEPDHVTFADATAPDVKERPPVGVQDLPVGYRVLHPRGPVRQFLTLCARTAAILVNGWRSLWFLLGLPVLLAALTLAVPGRHGLGPDPQGLSIEAERLLLMLVGAAALLGLANGVRGSAAERGIYRRERATGLWPSAYLAARVLMLLLLDAVQVAVVLGLTLLTRPGPTQPLVFAAPVLDLALPVFLVAAASTAAGLLASVLVRTVERTTLMLVVGVAAELALSGGLLPVAGRPVLELIATLDPARWGLAASAATVNLVGFPFPDSLWDHEPRHWWLGVGILGAQTTVLLLATRLALRRLEPGRN